MNVRVQSLPVRIALFPTETVRSFYRRLCVANKVSERDLWLYIRRLEPGVRLQLSPRVVPHIVCILGGLPPRYFLDITPDRDCNGHEFGTWSRQCRICRGRVLSASTMCRRCAHGDTVSLNLQTGPICVKHQRWHLHGLDVDVSAHRAQLAAQRVLDGPLRMRHLHYRSPEAAAVRELIYGWYAPVAQHDERLDFTEELATLPQLVWMLTELSSPFMIEVLKDKAIPSMTLATVLNEFADSAPDRRPAEAVVAEVLEHAGAGAGAPLHAMPRLLRYLRIAQPGDKARQLRARASTLRANLLHHLNWSGRDPLWILHDVDRRAKLAVDEFSWA